MQLEKESSSWSYWDILSSIFEDIRFYALKMNFFLGLLNGSQKVTHVWVLFRLIIDSMRQFFLFFLVDFILEYFAFLHVFLYFLIDLFVLNVRGASQYAIFLWFKKRIRLQLCNALIHAADSLAEPVVEESIFVEQVLFTLIFEKVFNFRNVYLFVLFLIVFVDWTERDF